jgi:NAD-dependent SIR2 family protein deacetylase
LIFVIHTNPKPFFALAQEFLSKEYHPTLGHHFIRVLAEKGLLLRNITQNIDALEANIPNDRIVYAHGNYFTSTCTSCGKKYPDTSILYKHLVQSEKLSVPTCDHCGTGVVKPDVVFFGENLQRNFIPVLKRICQSVTC